MNCRLIDTGFMDASMNMAIDEALLISNVPVLRFYGWKPRALSLGYNQDLSEINTAYCTAYNIPLVKRITGGKAVLHDQEITYSFIIPRGLGLLKPSVSESYHQIATALYSALRSVGVAAELQPGPEQNAEANCFTSSNWYELLVKGKKISGSAQRRMNNAVLQHGSILVSNEWSDLSHIFSTSTNALREKMTSLKDENITASYETLRDQFARSFASTFSLTMIRNGLTVAEKNKAMAFAREKYKPLLMDQLAPV